jgi:hypothetical protein
MPASSSLTPTIITVLIVGVVMALRLRRLNQTRTLNLRSMWIFPGVLTVMAVALLVQLPPRGGEWLWLGVAIAIGAVFGWWRGKLVPISVHPENGTLETRTSPIALLFLVVLMAVRYLARGVLESEAGAWHLSFALITDAFVVLATALFVVSRLEMTLRATRLLNPAPARLAR